MGKIRQLYKKVCLWLYDNFIYILLAVLFFCGIGCAWLLYTERRTDNEYNDVNESVQSIESDNREARRAVDSASAEIDSAQKQLNDSIRRAGEITNRVNNAQKRVDSNSKIVGECEDIISAGRRDTEEARSIFADVDKANKTDGTQADGT